MFRVIVASAIVLCGASSAHAQLSNTHPFLEIGVGGFFPGEMEGTGNLTDDSGAILSTNASEQVDFNIGMNGFGEVGVRAKVNDNTTVVGFVGASYASTGIDYRLDGSNGDYMRSTEDGDVSYFGYYVGAGVALDLGPSFELGANIKLGGASVHVDDFSVARSTSGTITGDSVESETYSAFMFGPELKAAYHLNDQIDLVGTGNIMFHYNDENVFEADQQSIFYLGAGVRFNLGL